ncbi:Hcp family type VI secretion system effector [Oceanospirillum sediminis]|uniref:Type VI secretion system tube protein Hcp n=1 Tax=Oceanospirillum sediminis TaxID=2760088 RepID=A0A839IPL1_9GAMM|nr:type VI secretion system tube protein Hcp [Oceanospirillum sediminis]MBB1486614.1 type VI secretion system tube protein Hcp [Oceanospirillum sediminis]
MASMYMRIDGINDIKGAATIGEIGGKKGFFAINFMDWGAARGVSVDVGNANNADKGMVALGEINIARESDGASPQLTTFLFSPGAEGKTVEILLTKPSREGNGADPYMVMTLEKARIAHYSVSCNDGGLPGETFSMTYTTLAITYYQEADGGKIEKGDTVKYDVTTAKLESKAK